MDTVLQTAITDENLTALRDYAAGRVGTRRAIERLGMRDYADLVIALAQNDFDMPKPAETPGPSRPSGARAPSSNRVCAMAIEVAIIVDGLATLITLAPAQSLDYLLYPSFRTGITLTLHPTGGRDSMRDDHS